MSDTLDKIKKKKAHCFGISKPAQEISHEQGMEISFWR